ncbi:hypothetical protein D3C87_489090 [compost metagenome]
MRTMRRIAWIATLLIPLHALPSGALEEHRPLSPSPSPKPALQAEGPPVHLSALGMLAPGSPQFILGQPVKAGAYLGGTALLGVGSYVLLRQIFYAESFQPGAFFPAESHALIVVNAIGLSWIIGGALSTFDAYQTLQAQQPSVATKPAPGPSATPQPAPSAKPTPMPVWAPTPQPTAIPSPEPTPLPTPRWTPAPSVVATPSPAPMADPESSIYRAYDWATKGEYLDAVLEIQGIRDPDWLPKVNALIGEWSSKAVDQGLVRARAHLTRGETDAAKRLLDRLSPLPRTAAQSRTLESLRQSLR